MTIKAFQTTYGPLRYNLATQIQPVLDGCQWTQSVSVRLCMLHRAGCSCPRYISYFSLPLVHKCSHYKIVIVHGIIATDTRTEVPDNTLLLDSQTQTSYYVAAAFSVEEFQCTFLIGDEQTHNETFVNVPLSSDEEYTVFIRLYSGLNVSYCTLHA